MVEVRANRKEKHKAEVRIFWKTAIVKVRGVKVAVTSEDGEIKDRCRFHDNIGQRAVRVAAARWFTNAYQYKESYPGAHFILLEVGLEDFLQFQEMFL